MDNMLNPPVTGNPADVAVRHLYVLCDEEGVAWGWGATPDTAVESARHGWFDDATFDHYFLNGFTIKIDVPATACSAAVRQIVKALQVIA